MTEDIEWVLDYIFDGFKVYTIKTNENTNEIDTQKEKENDGFRNKHGLLLHTQRRRKMTLYDYF